MFRILIICLCVAALFAGPAVEVFAQTDAAPEYQLLSGIPGLESIDTSGDFSAFINSIYRMAIGLASILAVLMIVSIGIRYAATDVAGTRVNLRSQLGTVLGGLVLLVGAYVLLEFVNPNLVEFSNKAKNFEEIDYEGVNGFEVVDVQVTDPTTGTVIGGGQSVPLDTIVWVPVGGGSGEFYATEQECLENADPREPRCQQTKNTYQPSGKPNDFSNGMFLMNPDHEGYRLAFNQQNVGPGGILQGAPLNPYRRPIDFASKGNGEVFMSRGVIESDRYIQDVFQQRFGKVIGITSAYRDPVHNANCCGSTKNHQTGMAIDYNVAGFSQAELELLQDLTYGTGARWFGFGPAQGNSRMLHAQWGGRNDAPVYWCYSSQGGPYKGAGSLPGVYKGSSCSY